MRKLLALPIILFALFGCNEDNATKDNDLSEGDIKITTNQASFNEATQKRGEDFSAPFHIMDVKREGDILNIKVSHTYACKGNYEVIWDGAVMESFPYQIRIFVKFIAECTDEPSIQIMVDDNLMVDLSELITDRQFLDNCVVHVSNASSVQDVNNDNATSNK